MPQILDLIKNQVNTIFRLIIEDNYGNIKPYTFMGYTISMKWLALLINLLSVCIYLIAILMFGLYLWNHGLSPVFTFIAPIGTRKHSQYQSAELQLFVTLIALFMIV